MTKLKLAVAAGAAAVLAFGVAACGQQAEEPTTVGEAVDEAAAGAEDAAAEAGAAVEGAAAEAGDAAQAAGEAVEGAVNDAANSVANATDDNDATK